MNKFTRKNTISCLLLLLILIACYKGDSLVTILWHNHIHLIFEAINHPEKGCSDEDTDRMVTAGEAAERRRIMELAKEIYVNYGPMGFLLERFSKISNISPQIIEHYFNDSEGLYAELMTKESGQIGCQNGLLHRVIPSLVVIFFWLGFGYLAYRLSKRANWESAPVSFLSGIGWGIILVLILAASGVSPSGRSLTFLFLLPTLVWLSHLIWRASTHPHIEESVSTECPHKYAPAFKGIFIIVILLFTGNMVDIAIWNVLEKSTPTGDEYNYWQISVPYLRLGSLNLPVYAHAFAYPVMSNIFLFFIPDQYFFGATYAIPFLFGFFLIWLVLDGRNRSALTLPQLFILALLFPLLFISHDWVHRMFFKMWYGEAMAILIIAAIFLAFDEDCDQLINARKNHLFYFIKLFGLGVLGATSKPPFSILIVWAFVPGIIVTDMILKRRKNIIVKTIFLGVGALIAEVLHPRDGGLAKHILDVSNRLDWNFTLVFKKLIPYFFSSYEQCWVPFVILAVVAVIMDKKNLSFLLVALGLIGSIIVLYATMWQNKYIDYESGGRYMLHGLYGWMLYFLATKRQFITEMIFDSLSKYYRTFCSFYANRFS